MLAFSPRWAGAAPETPPTTATPPAGVPAAGGEPTALQLTPSTPALSRTLGVIAAPGIAELLQKVGCVARVVTPEELDAGLLDPYGLLMVNLERPLSVTGAAFLRDYVSRGGSLLACSWGASVAPARQAAFPAYRLQDLLLVRVTGWSATRNTHLRSANSLGLFRGLPEYIETLSHATPLLDLLPGARLEGAWAPPDGTPGTRPEVRSPAIVVAPRCTYFAPNILAEVPSSRYMLRLLANTIGILLPAAAPEPARLSLAEMEIALAEARRAARASGDADVVQLLVAAEAKAAAVVQLAEQTLPPIPPPGALAPAGAATAAAVPAPAAGADPPAASTQAPAGAPVPVALPTATAPADLPQGGATPAASPETPPAAAKPWEGAAAVTEAIDAADQVGLAALPTRAVEARAVLLPRGLLPPSRTGIGLLLDRLRAIGVNLVLPDVYSAGYTLAPGPRQDPRFAGHDPLTSLIEEAGARGMAVHAWVSLLSIGPPSSKNGFPEPHPPWSAQTRSGTPYVSQGAQWLCPSRVDVREALCEGVHRALSGYRVQGVLLDGVDYGGVPEACYDSTCVSLFRGDTGRNPRTEALRGEAEQEWLLWRRERVGTLVRRVVREIRLLQPRVPVHLGMSAASVEPRANALADWRSWMAQGWVDGICPRMQGGEARDAAGLVERIRGLSSGARVLPILDTASVRTARHAMLLIGALQEDDAAGVIFDLPTAVNDRWGADLMRGSFRKPARLPW